MREKIDPREPFLCDQDTALLLVECAEVGIPIDQAGAYWVSRVAAMPLRDSATAFTMPTAAE